jgi:predicted RNase H-like nuclease (RuvC/YqgF family)
VLPFLNYGYLMTPELREQLYSCDDVNELRHLVMIADAFITEYCNEIKALKTVEEVLNEEIDSLNKKVDDLTKQVVNLDNEADELVDENVEFSKRIDELEKIINIVVPYLNEVTQDSLRYHVLKLFLPTWFELISSGEDVSNFSVDHLDQILDEEVREQIAEGSLEIFDQILPVEEKQ